MNGPSILMHSFVYRPMTDSAIALSLESPTDPIEATAPASRSRVGSGSRCTEIRRRCSARLRRRCDRPARGSTAPSPEHEGRLGGHAVRGAPADDAAGEHVSDERGEPHPGRRRGIDQVNHPQLVGPGGGEDPLHEVRRPRRRRCRVRTGGHDCLPRTMPRSPSSDISRATVHGALTTPSRLSRCHTFQTPATPRPLSRSDGPRRSAVQLGVADRPPEAGRVLAA
jgi:hypothetical protein